MRFPISRYAWVSAALIVFLALVVGLNDLGHFNTDIKPEVYLAPWAMVGRYVSSWTSSPYLGSANFNVGLVPVLLVLSALRGIGLNPEWTFKVFHFFLWLIAAWGANRLTRAVAPRRSRWAGLAAGVFYLANPYTIAAGNTLAIALPMAFLPWMLLCYFRALQAGKGWAWPAAFGLTFFAMSGMNVAVVPLLQLVGIIPMALMAWRFHHRTWREIIAVTARCAIFVVGVSLYWLIPGITALTLGTQVVDSSETLTGIHKVSSLTEVLRGLGLWPLYGHSDAGAWVPQNASYVTSWPVILLTGLWPALAALAMLRTRGPLRRALAATFVIAAIVMVGMFPGQDKAESPFGWLLQGLLSLPPLAAFRTTNKIGALLALACALGLAAAVVPVWRWLTARPGATPAAAGLSMLVISAWILPAITNGLYISRLDIPSYWKSAAEHADQGHKNSTTLLLPGQTRPSYRWSVQRPDDLTNSLLQRDAVIPETTPNASAAGGNFLAALDDAVQEGVATGDIVSTYARYLGADNVLLRHDVVWETDGGARPAQTDALLSSDRGLFGAGNFGRPGQNVLAPGTDPASYNEMLLPPVQLYGLKESRTAVRAESLKDQIIVAGDGWAFTAMQKAGLLAGTPTVRYAQDLTPAQLKQAIAGGAHLVVTDTNARRAVIPQRLTAGEGALLAADEPLKSTRTLGTNPADQSVLLRSGTLVKASASGGTFFDLPYSIPENAVDGNPDTSWRFGDFRTAPSQTLTADFPSTETLNTIDISQADLGPVKIDEATLTAGGKSVTVKVPDTGKATFDMGGVRADGAKLTIKSIRGDGFNLVGVSELDLPGPKAKRAARTPQTLSTLQSQLMPSDRAAFASTPLDILLTRVQNTPSPADDSEIALRRVVSVPDARTFDVTATVRMNASNLESLYDRVAGYVQDVTASSSGYWFNTPTDRASQAIDTSADTGWVPGGNVRGAWWQVQGEQRSVSQIAVTQKASHQPAAKTQWAKNVSFLLDGNRIASADLDANGTSTIPVPDVPRGSTLRMVINSVSGPLDGAPARFNIDAGWQVAKSDPGALDQDGKNRCLPVATVDGQPLLMRLEGRYLAGAKDQGVTWKGCGPVSLSAGDHRIEQADDVIIDSMNLMDSQGEPSQGVVAPVFSVTQNSPTTKSVRVRPTPTAIAVVAGQSFDPRWSATLNGKDLGAPTTIDGFSTGWILPKGTRGTIIMTFAPQRSANIAMVVSFLVVMGALALVLLGLRRGRLTIPAPHRSEQYARQLRREARVARGTSMRHEILFVGLATFGLGVGGLVGGLALVALRRIGWHHARIVLTGAALMMVAFALYCVFNPSLGTVDADVMSANMWPHRLAAVGLALAAGALILSRPSSAATRQRLKEPRHDRCV